MSQSRVQTDPVRSGAAVDANGIMERIVRRGSHIKSGAGEGFQSGVHILDGAADRIPDQISQRRKIRSHPRLQICQDFGRIRQGKSVDQQGKIGIGSGQFPISACQRLHLLILLLKRFLKQKEDFIRIPRGSGIFSHQPGVIGAAIRLFAQPTVVLPLPHQQSQLIAEGLIGGKNYGGQKSVVFGEEGFPSGLRDQSLGKQQI